jgi:hypothetical protein
MVGTIVSRAVLAVVTAARCVSVWGVSIVGSVSAGTVSVQVAVRRRRRRAMGFRRRRRSRGSQARVEGLHIEGQVVGLRTGESGGAVDGEEFFEEAVALAALDVTAAAAGVGVGVQRHLRKIGGLLWWYWWFVGDEAGWIGWCRTGLRVGFITSGWEGYGAMAIDCCSEAASIGYLDKACEVLLCRLGH